MIKRISCIVLIVFLLMLGLITLLIPITIEKKLDTRDETVTEVWDKNTEGPIYGFSSNDDGIIWIKYYRGYADGDGNIYINSYNLNRFDFPPYILKIPIES